MNPILNDILVAAALLAALLAALEGGYRAGRRGAEAGDARGGGQVGAIQGATLGLLGLLLAFSFSAAGSRFLERQDLITAEANAIGTAYLRADLIDGASRDELRAALKEYTQFRIGYFANGARGLDADLAATIERQHARIWQAAINGVKARPETMLGVLPPVNDVIDLHSTRIAAGRKHIPKLVMGLLIAASLLSVGCMGYSSGLGGRRRAVLNEPVALLIAASLWITIDLDQPRGGLMRLSDAPLEALKFEGVESGR